MCRCYRGKPASKSLRSGYSHGVLAWLLESGIGPAVAALPVNWAAGAIADAARRWFRRLRRADSLSRLVSAATGTAINLTHAEFDSVRMLLEDPETWRMLGHGTVEDLVNSIASCLPPRTDRTCDAGGVAAMVIARGLLEFAVADVDPKVFQQ